MIQNIFIIGATGNVGKELINQIYSLGDMTNYLHKNPTKLIGVASSKDFSFDKNGIETAYAYNFSKKIIPGNKKYNNLDEIIDLVLNNTRENVTFIDVTADKNMIEFHKKIIQDTNYNIVTANKNPLAFSTNEEFKLLTQNPKRYGYRCSVMAGAESITALQDLRDVNDQVNSIQGCFSGTLGYINSELEKEELKFSEIVEFAKVNGFTEPHPRDDLNGIDVARKLLILSRTAGYNISMSDINIKPFITEDYLMEDDISKFMNNIKDLDEEFEEKVLNAKNKNKVLRYVAQLNKNEDNQYLLNVGLKSVPKNSSLGSLEGTLNKIVIESSISYPKNSEYSIQAPGAGLEVTAQNIRRDLLHQLENREIN